MSSRRKRQRLPALVVMAFVAAPLVLAAAAHAQSDSEVASAFGTAAAIMCGVFGHFLVPEAGAIAGMIAVCLYAMFDAIYL